MSNTKNLVPARVSFDDLIVRGGGTPDESRPVVFERGSHQFKAPGVYVDKPLESKQAYSDEIDAMFETITHNERFPYYGFNDVAVNFTRLMRSCEGGVARSKRVGLSLPSERQVEIGYDAKGKMQYETIPGNWMTIPGLGDNAIARVIDDDHPVVQLQYPRYCQDAIVGFLAFLHDMLRTRSIYQGHAISYPSFEYTDVSRVDPNKAVYSATVGRLLNKWCLAPITHHEANDAAGIGRKSNVLLTGKPGTGKTLFLNIIKKHAVDNGWLAMELKAGSGAQALENALNTARVYMDDQPGAVRGVVLIAEDIEKMAQKDRAKTLEVLDGARGKFDRLITVLTTNFPEELDAAMVRAERIHAVISIELPDVDVYRRLVEMRLGDQLAPEIDWDAAFTANEGYTPAWIIGGLESVVRGVVAREGTHTNMTVTTEDLVDAANDYRPQYDLQVAAFGRPPEADSLAAVFSELVRKQVAEGVVRHISDLTDYGAIGRVVRSELDDTRVELKTESGNKIKGGLGS